MLLDHETAKPAVPAVTRPQAPLDDAARTLVRDNLPIVGYLVSELISRLPQQVQRDDLVSAGQLALVKAARSYDATTGVPFGHYVRTRIRGALVDELRAADWASRGARTRAKRLSRTEERLAAELGRWPSDVELARELDSDLAAMSSTRSDAHRSIVMSLDHLVDSTGSADEHLDPGTHAPDPSQQVVQAERVRYLTAAVQALPERLRVVVEMYFLGERPMAEIAQVLQVSESRVSQLRAEALALLKDGMNSHLDPAEVPVPERPDGVVARRRNHYYAQVAAYAAAPARAALPAARFDQLDRRRDVTLTA